MDSTVGSFVETAEATGKVEHSFRVQRPRQCIRRGAAVHIDCEACNLKACPRRKLQGLKIFRHLEAECRICSITRNFPVSTFRPSRSPAQKLKSRSSRTYVVGKRVSSQSKMSSVCALSLFGLLSLSLGLLRPTTEPAKCGILHLKPI